MDRENLDKFKAKSDLNIFLGYSINNQPYKIFNLGTFVVESINVVIDDFGATSMVKFNDNDAFEN